MRKTMKHAAIFDMFNRIMDNFEKKNYPMAKILFSSLPTNLQNDFLNDISGDEKPHQFFKEVKEDLNNSIILKSFEC